VFKELNITSKRLDDFSPNIFLFLDNEEVEMVSRE